LGKEDIPRIVENCFAQRKEPFGRIKPLYPEDVQALLELALV